MKERCSKIVEGRRCVHFAGAPHKCDAPLLLDDKSWARIVELQEKTQAEEAKALAARAVEATVPK